MTITTSIPDRRFAAELLADRVRQLVNQTIGTEAKTQELIGAASDVARTTAILAQTGAASNTNYTPFQEAQTDARAYSPALGTANPIAPPLLLRSTVRGVAGDIILRRAYEGPRGFVHGGVLALLMDEVLGRAVMEAGHWGMTASLRLQYLQPVPLNQSLRFSAQLSRCRSSRTCEAAGVVALTSTPAKVLLRATGTFVSPRAGDDLASSTSP